jgi:ketosteroid isomerase-like protein
VPMSTPVDVAVAYLEAWAGGDMTTVADHLAEDVSFEGPMAQATGAGAVLDAISGSAEMVTELKILAATGDDEQAIVMYDMVTAAFGTLRAAEHLVVSDGKIHASTLVFDTYPLRSAPSARAPSG